MIHRILMAMVMIMAVGCSSFSTRPGHALSLPAREPVFDTTTIGMSQVRTVSVRVDHDRTWAGMPWCDMVDAGGDVHCTFSLVWLETMPMQGGDAYRGLHFSSARQACDAALWSIGQTNGPGVVEACARALVTFRWMEDLDYGVEDPRR